MARMHYSFEEETPWGTFLMNSFGKNIGSADMDDDRGPLKLEPHLMLDGKEMKLYFRLGFDKLFVVKDLKELMNEFRISGRVSLGKSLSFSCAGVQFEEGLSRKLWDMLNQAAADEQELGIGGLDFRKLAAGSRFFDGRYFRLTTSARRKFFEIMEGQPVEYTLEGYISSKSHIRRTLQSGQAVCIEQRPPLKIRVKEKNEAVMVELDTENIHRLDQQHSYFLKEGIIYHADNAFSYGAKKLFSCFYYSSELQLKNEDVGRFMQSVLPELKELAEVTVDEAVFNRFQILPLEAEAYVDYYFDGVSVRLVCRYGDKEINPLDEKDGVTDNDGRSIIRDAIAELKLKKIFKRYGFEAYYGMYIQTNEERAYDFLQEGIAELDELAAVYYEASITRRPVSSLAQTDVGVSISDGNLLEVSVANKSYNFKELLDILNSYRRKKRYHRMKDGRFVTLEERQLAALDALIEEVGAKSFKEGKAEVPLSKAVYLDSLGRESEGIRMARSSRFKQMTRALLNPEYQEREPSAKLQPVMRDYQRTGFSWLSSLAFYGLGGILADDMGLGKTLQVLSLILTEKEEAGYRRTSLVVAPTSLIFNWLEEIQKFTPQLDAVTITGNRKQREEIIDNALSYDIIITTYQLLQKDIDLYESLELRHCILDEAQHIKNAMTKTARAVKKLKAECCFALTGTPIENNLSELWSIFDFILAGYLGSHESYRRRFELPIVKEDNAPVRQVLIRRIAPFVLRRMKKDVLSELPEKIESHIMCQMTEKQSKLYDAYLVQAKQEFANALKLQGFGEVRMQVIAIITRLRQICCDPSVFLDGYEGGSGKLEQLMELVEDATAMGHRLLIFSQFTTMLSRIADGLRARGCTYMYLDGSTPASERLRLVKSFNGGETQVFLISLKAGGTGLNLTGADMVIHYDQWWNPAVEDQATDRAYRIGQKNNVQVIKLITKDTIEEKIFALQNKKKALIDQMIQPGQQFISSLSEEEIKELFR